MSVIPTLEDLLQICRTNTEVFRRPELYSLETVESRNEEETPTIEHIVSDFISLSKVLGQHTTAFALTFKPPIKDSDVLNMAAKITPDINKFTYCTKEAYLYLVKRYNTDTNYKSCLLKEIQGHALEITKDLGLFLELAIQAYPPPKTSRERDERAQKRKASLYAAGRLWQRVEAVEGMSRTELMAAKKTWVQYLELLQDCHKEVLEMKRENEELDEEEDDENEDNEERGAQNLNSEDRTEAETIAEKQATKTEDDTSLETKMNALDLNSEASHSGVNYIISLVEKCRDAVAKAVNTHVDPNSERLTPEFFDQVYSSSDKLSSLCDDVVLIGDEVDFDLTDPDLSKLVGTIKEALAAFPAL